jgi:hypothetical protein
MMDVVIEAQIKGAFGGWKQGNVFVLNQGYHKKWKQVEDRYQFRNSYRPKAKLLRDGLTHYLEVEGMDDMVEVKRA